MQMDDFEVILGKGILRRAKGVLMSFKEQLVILDRRKPCVVRTTTRKLDGRVQLASVLENEEGNSTS